jgi:hypothetical protein
MYNDEIKELEELLHKQNKRVYRNIKFEKSDVNTMFRGLINNLFDLKIIDKQYVLKINMKYNKSRKYKFSDNLEFLLWIYRRIELANNKLLKSSQEDKIYYNEIVNQLTQLADFVKNNDTLN